MPENEERSVQVVIAIKRGDGFGSVASSYCTEQEIKSLSTKDFLARIVAPISAFALSEAKEKYF